MRLGLYWKILAAFAVVIAATLVVVIIAAGQSTRREFNSYVARGMTARVNQVAADLGDFYASQGSWDNVQNLLSAQTMGWRRGPGGPMGGMGMMMERLRVADERGDIVADTNGSDVGRTASRGELQSGVPLYANQQHVGTLLVAVPPNSLLGQQEQNVLNRINRALLLAGLAAGVLALLIGFVILRSITAPLNKLTAAAQSIAHGDLAIRVDAASGDEIARVGQAFNLMAAALQSTTQQRRDMMADIAHELRTPLSVIQGNLEAIRDGVYPADNEHLEPALDQAHLLARLVEDLRTLALAESQQLALERQAIDIESLVGRIAASFEAHAARRQVTITVQAPPSALPQACADSQRIAQVLANLLENALRYTPEGGAINITVQPAKIAGDESLIEVVVADSGPGIPPQDLPHVFDRFYRVDKNRSRQGGGSGLGLAIAKSIVEAHGGTIRATSEPRQGTAFTFTVPTVP